MPKDYKIKRSKYTGRVKPRRNPLFVVLAIILAAGLGYVGFISYEPIYNAIMGRQSPPAQEPEPTQPVDAGPDTQPEEPPPEPEPQHTQLRAVYLPPSLMGNEAQRSSFLDGLDGAGLNAVLVDLKDKNGQVLFDSKNESARAWNAVSPTAFDLSALARDLEGRGLSLMVRMSAFCDQTAARADKDLAVNYRAPGTLWLDNFQNQGGKPWLNPYGAGAQKYLLELALEAVECGAVCVVLDDFQFPPNSLTGDAYFGETGGVTRSQILAEFSRSFTAALEEKGARAAIYMTASALAAEPNATLYGGDAADVLTDGVLLGLLPYQFPEGYSTQKLAIQRPLANPSDTVRRAASFAREELEGREMMALIQGGNGPESATAYTIGQITAQLEALAALEITEYVFYCTDPAGYLLPTGG